MKVTEKDVAYVADLANLELTPEERTRMLRDLNSVLEYIDKLNQLDTSNIAPNIEALVSSSVAGPVAQAELREDLLRPGLQHKEAMQNAPDTDGDFFRVPKVIER